MSTVEFNQVLLLSTDFLKPFAITLTRDNEAAKDLMQETMYKALANREKYSSGTNIKAWLYTIMRNIFINNYRRRSRQNIIFDNSNQTHLKRKHDVSANYSAHAPVLHMKEMQEALFRLPAIFKTPFLLYCDGYKYHEIAAMIDEPLGTIKSRIFFARKLLKASVER